MALKRLNSNNYFLWTILTIVLLLGLLIILDQTKIIRFSDGSGSGSGSGGGCPNEPPEGKSCCESEAYDPNSQTCCNKKVQTKDENHDCCKDSGELTWVEITTPRHCGGCKSCTYPAADKCINKKCTCGSDGEEGYPAGTRAVCCGGQWQDYKKGFACCDGKWTDTRTDIFNCGSCGSLCISYPTNPKICKNIGDVGTCTPDCCGAAGQIGFSCPLGGSSCIQGPSSTDGPSSVNPILNWLNSNCNLGGSFSSKFEPVKDSQGNVIRWDSVYCWNTNI